MDPVVLMDRTKMRVTELQSELQNRGLDYLGLKPSLVARLLVDDLLKAHSLDVDPKLFEPRAIELGNQLLAGLQQKLRDLGVHPDGRRADLIGQILLIENGLLRCVLLAYVT